jgi:salicylate hydroxylase
MRILIVGAGLGGLTAGLALLQRGFDVRLMEAAARFKDAGGGIQLGPNGTRALFALGLADRLLAVSTATSHRELRLWSTGRRWRLADLGRDAQRRYAAPYLMLHRADLQSILLEAVLALRPDAISFGTSVAGCAQAGSGATIELGDGRSIRGDAVIGADGVHSAIRRSLFGTGAPRFTGMVAWRGVVRAGFLPGPPPEPVMTSWVGPGGHLVHYPLRGGSILNLVAVVERTDWISESWTEPGSREDCARDFVHWHPEVRHLIAHLDAPHKRALIGHDPLPRWSEGCVTLLGDAAHPTLPFLAQGACMALEDGVVLARCLEAWKRPDEALKAYETARLERTTRVVHGSAENGRRSHSRNLSDEVEAQTFVDAEWARALEDSRYDWLYRYDAATVPLVWSDPTTARGQ